MNWRDLSVSACGTHHECDGQPAYSGRFDEVLKFHAPGLAPVKRGDETGMLGRMAAQPIRAVSFAHLVSMKASQRCRRRMAGITFVQTEAMPILSGMTGAEIFQGGRCTVRLCDERYRRVCGRIFRVSRNLALCRRLQGWVCVIQSDAGLCTHLNLKGELLHGNWFVDLDVFHKSFARARDGEGWMHVDLRGVPAYARRFAAVEPFYNGQARVERFDGGLEVINEQGKLW